jgi:hypothetical protein
MKKRSIFRNLYWALTAVLLFSTSARSQNQAAVMPGPGWQVIKADWGSGNRWMDVTNRVRVLLSGNGMVQVTNSNLGGDPAQGTVKVLRIQARNSRGQSRQFTYNENDSIDASQFYNYSGGTGGGNGGSGLQVMQAEWGSGNRRTDVTSRVRALLSGNGMVKVNNANMGGDPAVGADKTLRIYARDMQGQVRQLSYKEGSNIDASQFYNYGGGSGSPGNPGYPANPGMPGGGNANLQIVRAYYGLNNRTNDVTQLLRGRVQNGSLVIQVNNNNMGGDPAVGGDKVLTVIYRYQGREQTSTVKEGSTLRIP